MIVGITDNEIPFMGVKEAIIMNTADPGLMQNELLGLNKRVDMPLTSHTAPNGTRKANIFFHSDQSIYNSGSTVIAAINSNNADFPSKSSPGDGFVLDYEDGED
jgi:hypothetical protein